MNVITSWDSWRKKSFATILDQSWKKNRVETHSLCEEKCGPLNIENHGCCCTAKAAWYTGHLSNRGKWDTVRTSGYVSRHRFARWWWWCLSIGGSKVKTEVTFNTISVKCIQTDRQTDKGKWTWT